MPQSTIDRRVQAKDDRMNAAIDAFRKRTGGAAALIQTPNVCPACGFEHVEMPGDDSTWRCARCDAPWRRPGR